MIQDFALIALKNIKKRRLRAFLTLLGIMIAIATIFVLISVSIGLQGAVEEQFRQLGTDKFFIQPRGQLAGPGTGGAVSLTEKDADIIKKVSGVKEVTFWTVTSTEVSLRDQKRFVTAAGIDLDTSSLYTETGAYKAQEGRLLKKGDPSGSIMIGSQYKDNNIFKKPITVGDTLLLNGKEFKVKGILKTIGNAPDDKLIYMSLGDFRPLYNITDRVDTIIAQVGPGAPISEVADNAEKKLMNYRNVTEKTRDFSILTPEELLASFGVILSIITGFLLSIAAISLLVGGIGIANTMFTSVLERTREIGVMKAIGAQNKDILTIFLIESGLLGLIGGILGVLLGYIISKTIEYIAVTQLATTLLKTATPLWLFAALLAFAFLAGSISGIWPAHRATKIKPVEALRYE